MSKVAARNIAHTTLSRMNMVPVLVDPRNAAHLVQDFREMHNCEDDDYMESAEETMRETLCATYGFERSDQDKSFAFAAGTAIIPIHGTLINRYGGYYYGYVTGYNFIRAQMAAAMVDDDVDRIILDVNSGGGQASGCFELADDIFNMRGEKPIMAVVDAHCYSAAYALASSADKIIVTPSGGAGSIGVISMHVDISKMLEDYGVVITLVTAGRHKADGHPYAPLPDGVREDMQATVDDAYDMFVGLVARNRGLGEKAVRDTEARCYSAQDALALGLIDAVATPTQAVAEFIYGPSGSEEETDEEPQMTTKNTTQPEKQQNAPAAPDATALSAAQNEGAQAEKARISAIMSCEAATGKSKMASHLAFNTSMSVADAEAMLAVAGVETSAAVPEKKEETTVTTASKSNFEKAMDTGDHPNVGPNATTQEEVEVDDGNDLSKNLAALGYNLNA